MMNYFKLFDIEIAFFLDQSVLTKKYYALSREHHPDRTNNTTTDYSSQINLAYKTLRDNHLRIAHILSIYNYNPIEGKEQMPAEFLMEMMDINEAIMEFKFDPNRKQKATILAEVDHLSSQLDNDLNTIVDSFDFNSPDPADLAHLKSYYLKSKYLRRLRDNLDNNEVEI